MIPANEIIAKHDLDPALFPDEIRNCLVSFYNTNGAIFRDDVGLMISSNELDMVKACIELFAPVAVIAPNEAIYNLRYHSDEGTRINFTHLIPWFEDNIFLLLFSTPYPKSQQIPVLQ
ncbi:hypothetical protein D3C87_686430 [compost metagenome]